jgi:predicted NACHT family NTPase
MDATSALAMTRTVRQIDTSAATRESPEQRPFADFTNRANVVLLGDPGAGKTHLFKRAADVEGARYLTARAFLNWPAIQLRGSAIYIDALDERRGGRRDRDTVDVLTQKLFQVSPPKVRISCRVADWLGESDLATLRSYFDQNGETAVVLLETLSREDQRAALTSEGAASGAAADFLAEAEHRGLDDLLGNPQNLLMLWRAVQAGAWPRTRAELFAISTDLMLREFDPERARTGFGAYSADELRPVAGAICAVRLISDAYGVILSDQEGTDDVPGYRTLTLFPPELVSAALTRRVFVSTSEPETVDYGHRTTAEYLAAEFLAAQVRGGLPFRRLVSLIATDGHPASELRGLHAWLAIHLPERAEQIIEADPYGVLTYGDPASLSTSSCVCLIRALGRLSKENPWFRSERRQSPTLAALARPDLIGELRAVLRDREAGFGIRSVVIDALWLGTPLPELTTDLADVLARKDASYVERLHALLALIRMEEGGVAAVTEAFRTNIGADVNGIRLRANVLEHLYGAPFDATDVVQLLDDSLQMEEGPITGLFWTLADKLPVSGLASILDDLQVPKHEGGYDKRRSEVGLFYSRALARAWRAAQPDEAGRLLAWLQKHRSLNAALGQSRVSELRAVMRETPEKLVAVAECFIKRLTDDKAPWYALARFREAIFFDLSANDLLEMVLTHLKAADAGSEAQKLMYEVAFSLVYQATQPYAGLIFEGLCIQATATPALQPIFLQWTTVTLPEGYFEGKQNQRISDTDAREKQRLQFDQEADLIRAGTHLGWISHLASIYFGLYSDADATISSRERLAAWIGDARVEVALDGFRATLGRHDVPALADTVKLATEHTHFGWWFGLMAGLDEHWAVQQDLAGLRDDNLQALVVFDATNPTPVLADGAERRLEHPWKVALQRQRPWLLRDAYLAIARARLSTGESYAEGLQELLSEDAFKADRGTILMQILTDFPSPSTFQLGQLLDVATSDRHIHSQLLGLADRVVAKVISVEEQQCDIWLAAAYFLSPARYRDDVERRAHANRAFVFNLRDRGRVALKVLRDAMVPTMDTHAFIAKLVGEAYSDTPYPVGGSTGDMNSWDASEYFRETVNSISSLTSQEATQALLQLAENPALGSYKMHVLYALANQRQRRRDAEHERPSWKTAIRTLQNGPPATVGDLHALAVEQLLELAVRIRWENTDLYKQFWNVDGYGRPDAPRPEEVCRDAVVAMLRPVLLLRDATVEPEGHMAADRRADIAIAMPGRKILCELKRDYHPDVWTAAERQLGRFYVRDPEAKGYGIYGVFWFGHERPQAIPTPPAGKSRPVSADEMQMMLATLVPDNMKNRIAVVVFDVSPPARPSAISRQANPGADE